MPALRENESRGSSGVTGFSSARVSAVSALLSAGGSPIFATDQLPSSACRGTKRCVSRSGCSAVRRSDSRFASSWVMPPGYVSAAGIAIEPARLLEARVLLDRAVYVLDRPGAARDRERADTEGKPIL